MDTLEARVRNKNRKGALYQNFWLNETEEVTILLLCSTKQQTQTGKFDLILLFERGVN
jgi:hypothetical protein